MDRFISRLPAVDDGDLLLALDDGVAWQRNQAKLVPYDQSYFDKCSAYASDPIAQAVNAARVDFIDKHFGSGVLCDVGIGDGAFLMLRGDTWGCDVNPYAEAWLKRNDRWAHFPGEFEAFSFWDVLEHVPTPQEYFDRMTQGSYLFVSIPVFDDLRNIRASKHYRPGEHLYYFTLNGFIRWTAMHGFFLLDSEPEQGRESIMRFAFEKVRDAS